MARTILLLLLSELLSESSQLTHSFFLTKMPKICSFREMFDFLDANKSGELYTAEAADGLRKLDDNRKIPFNLTWREVNNGVSYFLKI